MREAPDPAELPSPLRRRPRSARFAAIALPLGVLLLVAAGFGAVRLLPEAAQRGDQTSPSSTSAAPNTATNATTSGAATRTPAVTGTAGTTATGTPKPTTKPPSVSYPPPVKAAAGKAWKLTFAEEFNGSTYSHSKLTPCFDWNVGKCTSTFNHGREHYQPSQVQVSNGTAKLIAAPLSPPFANEACQGGSCTYKAGLLSTARPKATSGTPYLYAFTYGYVEARFKFPAKQGFFTAFWMLPADPSFDYATEIDILELLGDDPRTLFMTYNYNNRTESYAVNNSTGNNGACPVKDYSKNFVRMGVDWQPGHIAWYIDGKKCAEFTNASQIENGPMQLILHMMVDNDWQRRWNVGLKDPTQSATLEVDYIHVFQQR